MRRIYQKVASNDVRRRIYQKVASLQDLFKTVKPEVIVCLHVLAVKMVSVADTGLVFDIVQIKAQSYT